MESAFGVDHGEVSKALLGSFKPRGRVPFGTRGPNGKPMTRAQRATVGEAGPTRPQRIKNRANKVLETPVSIAGVGRATSRLGESTSGFLGSHPGATGAAILGGGSAAGYKFARGKEPKRKRSS